MKKLLLFPVLLSLCLTASAQVYQSPQVYGSISNLLARKPSSGAPFADIDTARYKWIEGSSAPTNQYILATPNGAGRWVQLVDNVPDREITIWQRVAIQGLTNYWAFGDSQTYGQTAVSHPYTDGANRIFAVYRYPNILASKYGLNLTNLAISGSGIAFTAGTSVNGSLGQLGALGTDWKGVVSGMHGYNDAGVQWGDIRSAREWFKAAQEATLARLFATNWTDATGTARAGTAQAGWTTTGTVSNDTVSVRAPFPPVNNPSSPRPALLLSGSQTLSFTAGGDVVIVFERWNQGGSLTVTTNGLLHGSVLLDTKGDGFSQVARQLPHAYWLRGLPSGTDVMVSNGVGTNRVLGVVYVGSPADSKDKFVILGAPIALRDRSVSFPGIVRAIGQSLVSAAQQFPLYQLALADANGRISQDMVPIDDPSHPDVQGQRVIADAFEGASMPSGSSAAATQLEEATILAPAAQFYGQSGSMNWNLPSLMLSFVTGEGYIDSYAGSNITARLPLNLRAKSTRFSGPLTVNSGFSGPSDYPPYPFIALIYTAGAGYVTALDGPSTLPVPLIFQGKNIEVQTGSFAVSGSTAQATNLPASSSIVLAETGSISYIDSYSNPQTSTFQPLQLRASRTVVSSGPLQAIGQVSTFPTMAANDSVVLSTIFGAGIITSVNPGATNWNQLQQRAESFLIQTLVDGSLSNAATQVIITNTGTAMGSGFLLRINDSNQVYEVKIGAAGSGPGGSGKALYIQ
jgi:hypothetical protein